MTEEPPPVVRRGYADSPFGQLHYAESGAGPALLLLHQTPRSHDEFRELVPLLAREHRVFAMDMLGFGFSASLPAPQTIEQYAAGALAFLDALQVEQAAVLGHHTGGAVAIEMAALRPDRVTALVLSSAPWSDRDFRASHSKPGVDAVTPDPGGRHLIDLWNGRRPYYPAGHALLDRFVHDALAPGVDPVEGHLAVGRYVMEARIGHVVAPTLLIGAAADPFAFPNVDPLREHLVSARAVDVAVIAAGTIPLMEQFPEEVARHVLPFLDRHSA